MGLSAEQLNADIDALAGIDPDMAVELARVGYPEPRIRDRGADTLLRTIVGQQVSVAAAASMWRRLTERFGDRIDLAALAAADDELLRSCGMSRQKSRYLRSLASLVANGELAFHALPEDDEAAIAELVRIDGVGRWSAEIYLLFAEGRRDMWPAGDLAVQEAIKRIKRLDERPNERATRAIAEAWRPYRGAAAIFAWHAYANPAL